MGDEITWSGRFRIKPKRIGAYGRSRFFFYDHTESGSKAVKPISWLFDKGIRDYLWSRPLSSCALIDQVGAALEKDGVTTVSVDHLEGGLDLLDALSAEMNAESLRLSNDIERWKNNEQKDANEKPFLFEINTTPLSRAAWSMALHPQILAIVNRYIHAHSRIWDLQYWINAPRQSCAPTASQLWHRDGDGTCIKVFVYLSDVKIDSGPFYYACGTHRGKKRLTHGKNRKMTDDELRDLFDDRISIEPIIGGPGTVIIANTSGYHKGGFVKKGNRLVLQAAYYCPWINRSDYGLRQPATTLRSLHSAQLAAIVGTRVA
jgi:hypothetical protein